MSKHGIGGVFAVLKEIATELGWNYSHGNLTEVALKAVQVYPLQHCSISTIAVQDQISTVTVNVMVADIVNFLKGENEQDNLVNLYSELGYTENSNYAHILENLYMEFSLKLREKDLAYNEDIRLVRPISMNPFIEADADVLAGFTVDLQFEIRSPWVTDCYNEV